MKRLARLLAVTLSIALVITSVGFGNLTTVHAKSTVKSVKVKGAKKKMTLKVGDVKTYKVKVKAKKGKTKFSVKSSNKKVVAAKKKGKKITLIALSVGKAKVTVKSKSNKKKKYVIKITVVSGNVPTTSKRKKVEPTVAPATEEPTAAPTTEPLPTVAPTTTVGPTTTKADVTTTAKTPTTAEPTTPKDTTTAEPTTPKVTTTAAPTTTTEETTTEEITTPEETTSPIPKPTEVEGLSVTSIVGNTAVFTWSQTAEQELSGQTYNVYLDGSIFGSYVAPESVSIDNLSDGVHSIKMTAVLDDFETEGVIENVIVEAPTTEAPTETTAPEETTTEEETTQGDEQKMYIGSLEQYKIRINFDFSISSSLIDQSDIVIQTKQNEADDYVDTINDFYFSKYSYSISIDIPTRIKQASFVKVQVTIDDHTYIDEKQAQFDSYSNYYNEDVEISPTVESREYVDIRDNGVGSQQITKIKGCPNGLDCSILDYISSQYLVFEVTSTVLGTYQVDVEVQDEVGCVDTYHISIYMADGRTVAAQINSPTYCLGEDEEVDISGYQIFSVKGGYGNYEFEIINNPNEVFSLVKSSYYKYPTLQYNINQRGQYHATVKVTDTYSSSIYTTVDITVTVKDYNKITGKVTDAKGRPIDNMGIRLDTDPDGYGYSDYATTDENGEYLLLADEGTMILTATVGGRYYELGTVDVYSDCVNNIEIDNIHKVTVDYDENRYGEIEWYRFDGQYGSICGTGKTFYLPEGEQELSSLFYRIIDGKLYYITSEDVVEVTDDMQVIPKFTEKVIPTLDISVGSYNVSCICYGNEKVFRFIAPKTGNYSFTTEFGRDENGNAFFPRMSLYDSTYRDLECTYETYEYETNYWNIHITSDLEEGQTYYLSLGTNGYEGMLGRFIIAEEDD